MKLNDFCILFKNEIDKVESVCIFPHVSADGDALGSSMALAYYLIYEGKKVKVVLEEKIPDKYHFLDNSDFTVIYEESEVYEADMYIAPDTGDIDRLGQRRKLFTGSNTWNIDHHKTNTFFGKYNFIDADASSVGEILFGIFKEVKFNFGKKTSEALFTAISTDTGGLRYSNTTPKSMRMCAELLERGIDIAEISHTVFDTLPYPKLQLQGVAISNLNLFFKGKFALIVLKHIDYEFLKGKDEYFDGIVNIAVNITGVKTGVLLRETQEGSVKVNLRSVDDDIDVALFAGMNGGGGHVRAAGFTEKNKDIIQLKTYILDYFGEKLNLL